MMTSRRDALVASASTSSLTKLGSSQPALQQTDSLIASLPYLQSRLLLVRRLHCLETMVTDGVLPRYPSRWSCPSRNIFSTRLRRSSRHSTDPCTRGSRVVWVCSEALSSAVYNLVPLDRADSITASYTGAPFFASMSALRIVRCPYRL